MPIPTGMTREDVARSLARRARKNIGPHAGAGAVYGLAAVTFAILHLAERIDAVAQMLKDDYPYQGAPHDVPAGEASGS